MNALFAKLHRAFVTLDNRTIGVSFPEVEEDARSLGKRLRLHGAARDLSKLMETDWITGMRDHLAGTKVVPVPDGALYRRVRRVQPKSNVERLRRRYAKRHPELSAEEVEKAYPESLEQRTRLPFLRLKSQSTGHPFCLFLDHMPVQDNAVSGEFNSYGLSAQATVPWF